MDIIEFTEDKQVLIGRITNAAANYSQQNQFSKDGSLLPTTRLVLLSRKWGVNTEELAHGTARKRGYHSLLCLFSLGVSNKTTKSFVR